MEFVASQIWFSGFEGEGGQYNDQERAGDEGDGESQLISFFICTYLCLYLYFCLYLRLFLYLYLFCRQRRRRRLRRRSGCSTGSWRWRRRSGRRWRRRSLKGGGTGRGNVFLCSSEPYFFDCVNFISRFFKHCSGGRRRGRNRW